MSLLKNHNIEKQTKTKIRVEGETKSLNSEMVKTKLKFLSSNTPRTLMRGVKVLGSCYNPDKAVMVSVGWKLQELNSADKLSNTINNRWNPTNFSIRRMNPQIAIRTQILISDQLMVMPIKGD